MRGKPLCVCCEAVRCGITPAHAGKTEVHSILPQLIRDHPRACGENVDSDMGEIYEWGSPPRVRGKLDPQRLRYVLHRITPRVCGENYLKAKVKELLIGITPACAGKTSDSSGSSTGS